MKRDMDLLRDIMVYLEENKPAGATIDSTAIKLSKIKNNQAILNEHILLLIENNFIEASEYGFIGQSGFFSIKRITSKGHDFLDALRDDIVWNKTKETSKKAGGGTVEMVVEIAKEIIKEGVKQSLGL